MSEARRDFRLLLGVILAALLALTGGCTTPADAATKVAGVSRYLDSIRNDTDRRLAFFRELPKGGDLHNHLSGSVTTETLIRFAASDGLCIDTASFAATPSPYAVNQRHHR
jgi:adenosine deaminase